MSPLTTVLVAVFGLCLGTCAWIYFGYPALMWLLARLRPRPLRPDPQAPWPSLTVVVPAHQEADLIADKVANTFDTDYPLESIELLVVSDGSTDGTVAAAEAAGRALEETWRAEGAAPGRVRVLDLPRGGKAAALDAGVAAATGEVLVLADANGFLDRVTLPALVAPFADPAVGGVCGRKRYRVGRGADATERGENLYWRYDQWLKGLESRVGSVFAADGTLYALRRSLYVPIADPAQADDIAISARVVLQGRRLVIAEDAVVWEEVPAEGTAELRRKVRVTNHSVRALLNLGGALWTSGFYSLQLLSHKFFRHLVPFFLLPMLAAHLALAVVAEGAVGTAFRLLLGPHLLFYLLALAGFLLRHHSLGRRRPLAVPYYFTMVNTAAFLGVLDLLAGHRLREWTPRGGAAVSERDPP